MSSAGDAMDEAGGSAGPSAAAGARGVPILRPQDVHVLVVDDEQLTRTVVASLLRKCSYKVTTAESGAEAVALLRAAAPGTYGLVLTDLCMPDVGGIEVLRYVRGADHLRRVPVVVMSAVDDAGAVLRAVQGGAEEYLVKPVTRREVAHIWQHAWRAGARGAPRAGARGVPEQPSEEDERGDAGAEGRPAARRAEEEAAPEPEEAPRPAPPALPAPPRVARREWEAAAAVLRALRGAAAAEAGRVAAELAALEGELRAAAARKRRRDAGAGADAAAAASGGDSCSGLSAAAGAGERPRGWRAVRARAPALREALAARRAAAAAAASGGGGAGGDGPDADYLSAFAADLGAAARGARLALVADVRGPGPASPADMVCAADFDAGDRLFATASVSRAVKVYDFAAALAGGAGAAAAAQYPVWQAAAAAKLSAAAWNGYARALLATADYGGAVQLWDVGAAAGGRGGAPAPAAEFAGHAARAWSVDWSPLDPMRLASGSDDGTARVWAANQRAAALRLAAPANVCAVAFSPAAGHVLALGCADHAAYVYDLRRPGAPVGAARGARRAVAAVRWARGGRALLAASTDSALRLWDAAPLLAGGGVGGAPPPPPERTYAGHANERNFVGLSVAAAGDVAACGSEDDAAYAYALGLPFPVAAAPFGGADGAGGAGGGAPRPQPRAFVSAVAWARGSAHLLAANSLGLLRVLRLCGDDDDDDDDGGGAGGAEA